MACFFGVLKTVMYTVHVGTLKAASLLATFLSLLCELPSKIRLMNTCACTMPSCWEDWTSKCHPWLRQRDSSCRRGCNITVSGVARGCNNGSCTWAIHHPKKKISGIVNCSTIYLNVNPTPETLTLQPIQNVVTRRRNIWKQHTHISWREKNILPSKQSQCQDLHPKKWLLLKSALHHQQPVQTENFMQNS
jgi:hypothetical protein